MLMIKQLTITDSKNHKLLDHFSFSLGANDKVGIIGEEGNGKSTLLKAIAGDTAIEAYTSISGTIEHDRKQIGFLRQSLPQEWDDCYVWEYILKDNRIDEIEDYNLLKEVEALCIQVQLPISLVQGEQHIRTLSGGERVKLQLLKLMLRHPDLLLLDEPSNDLDIETLEWLGDFLVACKSAVMFISHDETLLSLAANRILHLEQRNKKSKCVATLYDGGYQDYVRQRHTAREKEIQIVNKEKQEYRKKKEKLNNIQNAVHDALNDCVRNPGQAALLAKKMRNVKAMEKRFEREHCSSLDSLEEGIHVYFDDTKLAMGKIILQLHLDQLCIGEKLLMKDVELCVKGPAKIAVIGKNGSGKSMLMKQIYELLKNRTDIRLGYMPQNYHEKMDAEDTPISFILEKEADREKITRCSLLLGRMKFTAEEMTSTLNHLSEGQKAKLYLLKFIFHNCDVLLLDEPTRNLSPLSNPIIRKMLKEYQGCILAVSHDRLFLKEVVDKIYEIKDQHLCEQKTIS